MSEALPVARAGLRAPSAAALIRHWHWVAFAGVLALASALNLVGLDQEGTANSYYAAAALSMSKSWHNFFFAAFDPGGFLAVDKPPLGLWFQAASVKLFRFSGLSILLPQALAGVASVAVMIQLVGRWFGRPAGLMAGLALATTPIAVVIDRNNTMDSELILFLLLAVGAMTLAVERGRLRWLLVSGVLIGLAFNVKTLEPYLVVPGLFLAYLVAAPRRWWTRVWHLAVAVVPLLVVSLAWVVAVDLIPASARPYVTNSGTNSEISLLLGYNGIGRWASAIVDRLPSIPFLHISVDLSIVPAVSPGIGDPGWLRLLSSNLAGQSGWLLPLAVIGMLAVALAHRRSPRAWAALCIWGGWLAAAGWWFSTARFFHLYYLVLMGPPVAALAGMGAVALIRLYRERRLGALLLPAAIAATALLEAHTLGDSSGWPADFAPVVGLVGVLAAGLLAVLLVMSAEVRLPLGGRWLPAALAVVLLGLLVAPLRWSTASVAAGNGSAWLPQAGTSQAMAFGGGGPGGGGGGFRAFGGQAQPGVGGGGVTGGGQGFQGSAGGGGFGGGGGGGITLSGTLPHNAGLVAYLEQNRGSARYLVATLTSTYAAALIVETGQPVMTLGGYQGWDQTLTPTQLASEVARGTVRFFLISGVGGPGSNGATNGVSTWVTTHCTQVSSTAYGSTGTSFGTLYDCAPAT